MTSPLCTQVFLVCAPQHLRLGDKLHIFAGGLHFGLVGCEGKDLVLLLSVTPESDREPGKGRRVNN